MKEYKMTAAQAKAKYKVLSDADFRRLQKDENGMYDSEQARLLALKKALSNFSKNNQSKEVR